MYSSFRIRALPHTQGRQDCVAIVSPGLSAEVDVVAPVFPSLDVNLHVKLGSKRIYRFVGIFRIGVVLLFFDVDRLFGSDRVAGVAREEAFAALYALHVQVDELITVDVVIVGAVLVHPCKEVDIAAIVYILVVAGCRKFGFDVRQIRSQYDKVAAAVLHPDDVEKLKAKVQKVINGEINSCKESYREFIDEKLYWFSTCFQTFKFDENNKPEIIVCLTTDITELREKDVELIKIKEFNNIRSIFVSNISHEIRTPLNAILGFSKVIADFNKTRETQYFNDVIQQNNEILLHMIDSILSLTRLEAGPVLYKKEITDLKDICHSALNLKSFAHRPEIEFVFDKNLPSLNVYTDKEYIKQVLYHILDNANKFTQKGRISLAYCMNEDGEALVEISDTGIGLTPEEIDKVFDRFFKIDDMQRGVGLGLSFAKRFITDLGGKIGVESQKGQGSKFWFTLPCSEPMEA